MKKKFFEMTVIVLIVITLFDASLIKCLVKEFELKVVEHYYYKQNNILFYKYKTSAMIASLNLQR